jgi:hypothetical protein
VLASHHCHAGEDRQTTLHGSAALSNRQLPQSKLRRQTPLQAMNERFNSGITYPDATARMRLMVWGLQCLACNQRTRIVIWKNS